MMQWWTRLGGRARWAAIIVASSLGGLALFLSFCLYTPPGHAVLGWAIETFSGGEVVAEGISGTPGRLRVRHLAISDVDGAWLTAETVRLDWHPLSAFGSHIRINRIEAEKIAVARRPRTSGESSTSTTVVDIEAIALKEVTLAPPVLGRRAVLAASGRLHYASRHDVSADLSIRRRDGSDRYEIHAGVVEDIARGTIDVRESGEGLAGGLIGMPDLGPMGLSVRAGTQGHANAIHFSLNAGLLDVSGSGALDLKGEQAAIDFSVVAPAMAPAKTLSWNMISGRGHLHGSFAKPDIDASLKITGLSASGTRIAALAVTINGTGGRAKLQGTVTGLALSGEKVGVFASVPIAISADADLAAPARPVHVALIHPLLRADARASTHLPMTATLKLDVPSLKALAPLTGLAVEGSAALSADIRRTETATEIKADGRFKTFGDTLPARLLGNANLTATVKSDRSGMTVQAALAGAAAKADVHGRTGETSQSFNATIALSDLSRLAPTLIGTLNLRASLTGAPDNGKLTVEGTALAATKGMAKQGIAVTAEAAGLPNLKTAHLRASGRFDGSPVSVKADIAQAGAKQWNVDIADARWRSARAQGSLLLAGNNPQGSVRLRIARLADFAPLTGAALAGSLEARADFHANTANVHVGLSGLAAGGVSADRIDLGGTIANPFGAPVLALTLAVPHFIAETASGSVNARISGALGALSLTADTAIDTTDGQSFTVTVDALADTAGKHVVLNRFQGVWRDQTVTLASPAMLDYANGLKFAATFVEGKAMQLTVAGVVPPKGAMNVKATGTADLGVLLSGLASVGQNVRGKIALDIAVTGTPAKPNVVGRATLSGGQIQDYTRGVNLTAVEAVAEANGSTINLAKFSAKAGPGTVSGSGTIDLSARGTPVDMTFTAANARPISSDLITAFLDSDLKLQGHLATGLTLSGNLNVHRGNINIPEKFPREVATLNVRRSHQPPPAPAAKTTRIVLALTLTSPGHVFVRGRGLEAEFEGTLKIAGTTGSPQVQGALEMRRGTLSLAGANLTFTSGTISFNGQALRSRIDPSLNLVAETESNGITATLKVTGTASQPKVELSSSPAMPQDEILAQLLFQQSAKSLSAMQLASVAQAAATLGGGGGGFDPVGVMRKSLGLDRLAVGSNQAGNNGSGSTTIEAGKYVLRNVYIGAQQDLSGGTKALVQVDLTKHLKAQAQVNTGPRAATTTSTPLKDNGDSIGLSYQFEY